MIRRFTVKLFTLLVWTIAISFVMTLSRELYGQEMTRHILALYDSDRGQSKTNNNIHESAETILNHLGCIVDYWDVATGLPSDNQMKKYRGVLTWFYSSAMRNAEKYLTWAERQINFGRKVVILGEIGAIKNRGNADFLPASRINQFAKKIGFVVDEDFWSDDIAKIELVKKVPEMVEFERTLDFELTQYSKYRSINRKNKVYLSIRRNDIPGSESDIVLTGPNGGFARAPYIMYANAETHKRQWRLNPFRFFEEAFALKGIPRPDVTTKNGLRIWMSHIDGDALISKSQVQREAYCGEVIRDEIIKRYQWPISVSVVVGEVIQNERFREIARSIFDIDWVEAASHSYAHPFYWADDSEDKDSYEARHLPIKGYEFNVTQEVTGSVDFINKHLLPKGKRVKNFFWTGNCKPTPEAISLCEKAGLMNVNGGDSIFDEKNRSYTAVAPLSANVGNKRQLYAPNSNENTYTNGWQGPYFGYKYALETFANTESPVRLRPMDVYYHFYSGERFASLNALKKVIDSSTAEAVAPIFMSEYLHIVNGYFNTRIEQTNSGWKIRDFGACKTIRFDNSDKYPDLERSQNVLGFNHYQHALYVHLADADTAEIILAERLPERIYFEQASHTIENFTVSQHKIVFSTQGYGNGQFILCNLPPNRNFDVKFSTPGSTPKMEKTNAAGKLQFSQQMTGRVSVFIENMN